MMTTPASFRPLLAATILALVTATGSAPAQAQQNSGWLWGGGNTYGGSGREVVRLAGNYPAGQVIVSFGDRRLYLITRPGEALSYPIAIPREQSRWEGITSVSMKRENPSWTPTPPMIAENPRLPRWVPGGHPMNPLGVRALYLGSSTYRIHGTDAPWTIGSAVSKGCIRMYNQDVIDLYPRVPVGTKVTVTWQTFRTGSAVAQAAPAPTPSEPMAAARKPSRRVVAAAVSEQVPAAGTARVSTAPPPPVASVEEQPARPRFASAKKVVAKRVTPKVTSAETLE